MKEKTCCFSGHRKIPHEQYHYIAKRLKEEIIKLIENGYLYFGAGGALGFDTLAAQTVLLLRKTYPQIKLILVLPCPEQTKGWAEKDIALYEKIKLHSDKFVYTSPVYTKACMHERNRHLADNSSVCICFLSENRGGTAYTVDYAKSKGLSIINVAKAQ